MEQHTDLPLLDPPPVMKRVLPLELRTREGSAGAQCLWMDRHALVLVSSLPIGLRQTVVGNIVLESGRAIRSLLTIVAEAEKPMRRGHVYAARWRVHDPQQLRQLVEELHRINPGADLPPLEEREDLARLGHRFMHSPAPGGGSIYLSLSSSTELTRLCRLDGGQLTLRLPRVPNLAVGDRPSVAMQLHDGLVIDFAPEVRADDGQVLTLVDARLNASARSVLMRVFEPERDPPSLISIVQSAGPVNPARERPARSEQEQREQEQRAREQRERELILERRRRRESRLRRDEREELRRRLRERTGRG